MRNSNDATVLETRRRVMHLAVVLALAGCSADRSAPAARSGDAAPRVTATIAEPTPTAAAAASAAPVADHAADEDAALPARDGDMLLVPAGSFTMGADQGGEADEHPAHSVTLEAFYLDATEVTNEAYAACIEAKVCGPVDVRSADKNHFGPDRRFRGPHQPISSISWNDASAYCKWSGKRLPTEAEWERAARGSDGRRYPWGNDPPTPERAVFSSSVTTDVATHAAGDGPFGHHDLAGNVWEWVEDVYDPFAYERDGAKTGAPPSCEEALKALEQLRRNKREGFTGSNPIPTECEHVLRGGAFNYPPPGLRATNRVHHPARYHLVMSGFRCAKDARADARRDRP